MTTPRNLVTILLIACVYFLSLNASAQLEMEAFEYLASAKSSSKTLTSKPIRLNQKIKAATSGQTLSIKLPNGDALALTIDQSELFENGDTLIIAADDNGNELILTMGEQASFGNIYGDEMRYAIGHISGGDAFILDQTDPNFPVIDLGNDGLVPPNIDPQTYLAPSLEELGLNENQLKKEGDSVITLLAVYSPQFAAGFGSAVTRINQMIAFTNRSFARSNIAIEMKLARAVQLNFNNSAGNNSLLQDATNGRGSFSGVEQLRNTYGADMVTVLRFQSGNSSSGIAWIGGNRANLAYSVVQLSQNCCDSVFAHEIGHNLGSGHERASVNPGASGPCDFNFTGYSCGHGNRSAGWGTVMSRLNSSRVNNVFSNPSLTCLSAPCGIPEGQANAADNARSFNISGKLTANFRQDPAAPPTPVEPPAPPSNPNGSVPIPAIIPLLLEDEN